MQQHQFANTAKITFESLLHVVKRRRDINGLTRSVWAIAVMQGFRVDRKSNVKVQMLTKHLLVMLCLSTPDIAELG